MPDDREPEAKPAMRARGGSMGLPELVEYVGKEFGLDSNSSIADADFRIARGFDEFYSNAPGIRRKLHRIRQQVPNHLLQPVRIAGNHAENWPHAHINADALAFGGRPHGFDCGFDDPG